MQNVNAIRIPSLRRDVKGRGFSTNTRGFSEKSAGGAYLGGGLGLGLRRRLSL